MDENEVIERLGLESSSELADLLGFDIVFCEENTYFKLGEKNNRGNANKNVLKKGWKVVLKGKNKSEAIERGRCKTPSKFPEGNVPKGKGKDWYFHRGHILGYTFHKYLNGYTYVPIDGENRTWTIKDINDPEKNLTTQFSYANEIQGIVEREIESYLSENKDLTLEVKVVYKGGRDAYPIGTEIFYKILIDRTSQNYQYGHYFIPNTDVGFKISDEAEESYQDFYTNGYSERYQEYFADSDRNEIELVEGLSSNGYILSLSDNGIFSAKSYDLNTKDETEIIDFKDIVDILEYPKSNIFFFCEDEIDSVDKFLKVKKIVRKSKKNKRYYPVEDNHSGIYLSYGINEGTDYDHCGRPTLKEAIKYKKQNSSKW